MKMKKMLSLLAAAAIAGSCVTGLAVNASAEGNTYREWNLASKDNATAPQLESNGELAAEATLTLSGKQSSTNFNVVADVDLKGYGTFTLNTAANTRVDGLKMQGDTVVTVETKLSENEEYDSYDLMVIFGPRDPDANGRGIKVTADNVEQEAALGYTGDTVLSKEYTGLTADKIELGRANGESRLFYVGVKYNKADSSGGEVTPPVDPEEPTEAQAGTWSASDAAAYNNQTGPFTFNVGSLMVTLLQQNEESGKSYTWSVSNGILTGGQNPRPASNSGSPTEKNLPVYGTAMKLVANATGEVEIKTTIGGSTKSLYIIECDKGATSGTYLTEAYVSESNQSEDGTITLPRTTGSAATDKETAKFKFTVTQGKEYYYYVAGSKMSIETIEFTPATTTEPEFTMPEVSVEASDKHTDPLGGIFAQEFLGKFTVGADNYSVSGIEWTATQGDKTGTDTVTFGEGTVVSGTQIVVGLVVKAETLDGINVTAKCVAATAAE